MFSFVLCLVHFLFIVQSRCDFNPFEDNLIFSINWAGPLRKFTNPELEDGAIVISTTDNEKYQCNIPVVKTSDSHTQSKYDGPTALELLRPLFSPSICVLKIDVYWSYELCHGSHLRQYHEDRIGGKNEVLQEYYLGTYSIDQYHKDVLHMKEKLAVNAQDDPRMIPKKKVDVLQLPYITVNMTDGSVCDVNGKPRNTRILYVCYPELSQEIYNLEEVSICDYEVLVLTSLLCDHPDYRIKKPDDNEIMCHSVDSSPKLPRQLKRMKRQDHAMYTIANLFPEVPEGDEPDKQAVVDKKDAEEEKLILSSSTTSSYHATQYAQHIKTSDGVIPPPEEFLVKGKCFHGGSGWWKYEYCPGVKVEQYHKEADGKTSTILLGKWDELAHLEWLQRHPHKKPKRGTRRHISHFYGNGNYCELANKPRNVEVKLRCKESDQQTATSLYLNEPNPCEYILVVEAPSLCSLIEGADENGLIAP